MYLINIVHIFMELYKKEKILQLKYNYNLNAFKYKIYVRKINQIKQVQKVKIVIKVLKINQIWYNKYKINQDHSISNKFKSNTIKLIIRFQHKKK